MQEEELLVKPNLSLSALDAQDPRIREDAVLFQEDTDSARYAEKAEEEMSAES